MEFNFSSTDNLLHPENKLPTPHLSFIIQLLLSKNCVKYQTYLRKRQEETYISLSEDTYKYIPVGSFSEGYNIPDGQVIVNSEPVSYEKFSDVDVLIEVFQIEIMTKQCDLHTPQKENKILILLDVQDTHKGYARLETPVMSYGDLIVHHDKTQKTYFSQEEAKQTYYRWMNISQGVIHGPAISENGPVDSFVKKELLTSDKLINLSTDKVLAFACKQWPSIARQWIDRQIKAKWLDKAIVEKVVEMGVHVVPTSHRHSLHPELEWRISFATSENLLAKEAITDYQRRCFIFLKIIYYIKLKPLDILTSYHLKTVFLYTCEKLPVNTWKKNIGFCLLFMINCLIECVKKKNIPSFFIPENNLIDHITNDEAIKVVHILLDIRQDPLAPVLEFTDTRSIYSQSTGLSFRDIIEPVLKDSLNFHVHRDMESSIKSAFMCTLCRFVKRRLIEKDPGDAGACFMDILLSNISGCELTVLDIANANAQNGMSVIQKVSSLVDMLLLDSTTLVVKGNIESMFQILVYRQSDNSSERLLALAQAEIYYSAVLDCMVIYEHFCHIPVHFCLLLLKQKRFNEAAANLDRFIGAELRRHRRTFHFSLCEISMLDDTLQRETFKFEPLFVNSLSLMYYLLVRCKVKDDLFLADPVVYGNILQDFNQHCLKINESTSYSLLGYCFLFTRKWESSYNAFCKADELGVGPHHGKVDKENISLCLLIMIHLSINQSERISRKRKHDGSNVLRGTVRPQ